MKKLLCLLLAALTLPVFAAAAYDSKEAAQAQIDQYMNALPLEEDGETVRYPEEFGGMYVDEDNKIVVCLVGDDQEKEQPYIDHFGSADTIRFQSVERPYSLLMQYYITIGARHVSTQYVIINLYKTKRYEINVKENRVDIYMYAEPDTLEEVLEYMDSQGFGEGIYIYFTDEEGENVLTNEDEVYAAKAEREANATPTPTPTPTPPVAEQLEREGITLKNIGIPVLVVVLAIGLWFALTKLRARKVNLDEEDDFSDEHKK